MPKGSNTSSKNLESPLLVVYLILQCYTVNIYNNYSIFREIEITS